MWNLCGIAACILHVMGWRHAETWHLCFGRAFFPAVRPHGTLEMPSLAHDIAQSRGRRHNMSDIFNALCTCASRVEPQLFDRLFQVASDQFYQRTLSRLPRRITVCVPPLSRGVQSAVQQFALAKIHSSQAPPPLKQWCVKALNVVPLRTARFLAYQTTAQAQSGMCGCIPQVPHDPFMQ